ncbi:hypothetical protein K353_03440 [Kitasatospora sp. SolWspMP-SS2h]|nr:hypothetical protein K353_03440 [Kitasatospora sp. SolWspMP-SS2h]
MRPGSATRRGDTAAHEAYRRLAAPAGPNGTEVDEG